MATPPNWSRLEATDTTFGPVGRIGWTTAVVLFALVSAKDPFLLLAAVPVGGGIIKDLWRSGWVVPDDITPRAARVPRGPTREWLFDRDDLLRSTLGAAVALLVVALVMFAPPEIRFVGVAGTTLLSAYLFLRRWSA